MKSRDRRAERMSEFVTNMFQYNVTVGITRSEVIFFVMPDQFPRFFTLRMICLKTCQAPMLCWFGVMSSWAWRCFGQSILAAFFLFLFDLAFKNNVQTMTKNQETV